MHFETIPISENKKWFYGISSIPTAVLPKTISKQRANYKIIFLAPSETQL